MVTAAMLKQRCPAALLLLTAGSATADVLSADDTSRTVFGWTSEPWVVLLMLTALLLYGTGYIRLNMRSRRARRHRFARLAAFLCGWFALVAALNSPLDALSAALFSAHMVQHELLMIVAAPMLVISRPLAVWMWAFPASIRDALGSAVRSQWIRVPWRWLTKPTVAWVLHAAALWGWHAPIFFQAALEDSGIHTLQHASFFASALLFWWTVFGDTARRDDGAHAMLSLFTTMVHTGALGALLTLAPALWYPDYVESSSALGFDPLHDQQLGGLVMWVPAGLAYLIGGLIVSARWLIKRPTPGFSKTPSTAGRED
jgi:cytochrome c oxidase assembly factor CtaG